RLPADTRPATLAELVGEARALAPLEPHHLEAEARFARLALERALGVALAAERAERLDVGVEVRRLEWFDHGGEPLGRGPQPDAARPRHPAQAPVRRRRKLLDQA